MKRFLILICCCLASTPCRAGLLTGELNPPTGSSYYSGYGQAQAINPASYNTGYSGSANIFSSSGNQGFRAPLEGGFTPATNHQGPYQGSTNSISHYTHSVPISVPQPYPVTVHHNVPVQVPVAHPVYKPRPVPVEVLQPYPVSVPRPYPVTVAKPVPVPIRYPVYVKVPQAVPVAVPQPYPVHVHKAVPVKVPTQIVVNVPVPVHSGSNGYNNEVGYGSGFGLGAYGQGGYLAGNNYQSSLSHFSGGHLGDSQSFTIGTKYTTAGFPSSSFSGHTDSYAYKGGFGRGGHGSIGHLGGVDSKFTHGLSGGLVDSLKDGHFTDNYKIHGHGGLYKGGLNSHGGSFGFGGNLRGGHINLADITIQQQYDANGGYKY